MTCEQVDMLMAQAVFGELDGAADEAVRLREHLEGCPVCREKLADMRITAGLIADAVKAPPIPKLSPERKTALLREVERQTPRVLVLRVPLWSLGLAASVGIAAISAWLMVLATREEPVPESAVALNDQKPLTPARELAADGRLAGSGDGDSGELGLYFSGARDGYAEDLGGGQVWVVNTFRGGWDVEGPRDSTGDFAEQAAANGPRRGLKAAARGYAAKEEAEGLDPEPRIAGGVASKPASPPAAEPTPGLADADEPRATQAPAPVTRGESVARRQRGASSGIDRLGRESLDEPQAAQQLQQQQAESLPPRRLFRGVARNASVETERAPTQQIALVSDTASYRLSQQYISNGVLPPPGAVRTEEFYNYVQADDTVARAPDTVSENPADESRAKDAPDPVSLRASAGPGVFDGKTVLLKIDVTAAQLGNGGGRDATLLATGAKLRVRFDKAQVCRYRLMGYEDHLLADRAAVAGEAGGTIRAGQTVSALYEVELIGTDQDAPLGAVWLRYRNGLTGRMHEVTQVLTARVVGDRTPATDPRFYLTAAAARFAELLREGPTPSAPELEKVEAVLEQVRSSLPDEPRVSELLEMVRAAKRLPPAP